MGFIEMALTPAEAALLGQLQAKAAEPDESDTPEVVVVVEAPEAPEAPEPADTETQSDVVIAGAIAQTIVIEAETAAAIELREHEARQEREREERWAAEREAAEPVDVIDETTDILDEVLGPVEEVMGLDSAPDPGHWFFRKIGGRK